MRVLFYEIKKIFNPIVVGIIVILGILFYYIETDIYFNMMKESSEEYRICLEWSEKYGETIDKSELEEIKQQLERESEKFENTLKFYPESYTYKLKTYDEFYEYAQVYYQERDDDEVFEEYFNNIENNSNYSEVQFISGFVSDYAEVENGGLVSSVDDNIVPVLKYYGEYSEKLEAAMTERLKEIDGSNEKYGYLPTDCVNLIHYVSGNYAAWVLLSVVLLLSPVFVRDKLHKTEYIQAVSKTGRKTFNIQIAAAVISSILITLINTAIYGFIILSSGVSPFLGFGLFSITTYSPSCLLRPWLGVTVGEYLISLALMALAAAVSTAVFTLIISGHSKNYVGMMLKAVPEFAVLSYFITRYIFGTTFFFSNALVKLTAVPCSEVYAVLILLAAAAISCAVLIFRNSSKEYF